ncbi:MAG: 50S ribosomal protein L1 [Candidatus Nezhaarchaeota archaeon]|nr:50S ribosomal protein L1 [Candidatus Nezhaarchaeota archaeon]MCX8142105.1 50S ribosomal protein L1 [Candidatus Nezhaarchaeota archaeon]MDW8050114.1 50S ribosomal protein L1 [Nitrososphaerota archaeon]
MSVSLGSIIEAVKEARRGANKRRFEQSFELIIAYEGLNLKDPAARINEVLALPNPIKGKEAKICVIAEGDLALKAKEAKADLILSKADVQKYQADKKQAKSLAKVYDFFLAQADLMPIIGRTLGPYLGPRGKMPTTITLGMDLVGLLNKFRSSIRVRIRNNPVVQCRVGVESMDDEEVAENIKAVIDFLQEKIRYPARISNAYVKLTMGPPVKIPIGRGG